MQVYLAGPISDGPNPYAWHERVEELAPEVDWINPFLIHDIPQDEVRDHTDEIIKTDLTAVRNADAVLLRRIPEYNLCGASIEAREAYINKIPVVVWNTSSSDIPLFLDGPCSVTCESLPDAVSEVTQM